MVWIKQKLKLFIIKLPTTVGLFACIFSNFKAFSIFLEQCLISWGLPCASTQKMS